MSFRTFKKQWEEFHQVRYSTPKEEDEDGKRWKGFEIAIT
jgi:hypothetical protein